MGVPANYNILKFKSSTSKVDISLTFMKKYLINNFCTIICLLKFLEMIMLDFHLPKKMQFQNSFLGIKVQLRDSMKHFVELKPLIYEEWDGVLMYVPLYIKLRREQ